MAATLGHRASRDLDFFVPHLFEAERLAERLAAEVTNLRITSAAEGTLYFEIAGVPASILAYRYPLLAPPVPNEDLAVPIASLEDLLCMKLWAVASRGLARDFWDCHGLLGHGVAGGELSEALALFRRKYATDEVGHVIRGLAYFGDADAGPLPRGLAKSHWAAIKRDFERWVLALG